MRSPDSAPRSAARWPSWRSTICARRPNDLGASANLEAAARAAVGTVAALPHLGAGNAGDELLHRATHARLHPDGARHGTRMAADDETIVRVLDVDFGAELAKERCGEFRARRQGRGFRRRFLIRRELAADVAE